MLLLVLGRVSGRWEGSEQRGAPHSTPEGSRQLPLWCIGAHLLPAHLVNAPDKRHCKTQRGLRCRLDLGPGPPPCTQCTRAQGASLTPSSHSLAL